MRNHGEDLSAGANENNQQRPVSTHYRENWRSFIRPFIYGENSDDTKTVSEAVSSILDWDDDVMLRRLQENDAEAFVHVTMIKRVSQAMREKRIAKDAEWFHRLQKKMFAYGIYAADTEGSRDLERGKREHNDRFQKIAGDARTKFKASLGYQERSGSEDPS